MRNIVGDVYESYKCGKFVVKEKITNQKYLVKFLTSGALREARLDHIKTGKVNDPYFPSRCGIGYIGVGKYGSMNSPRKYQLWSNMMKRCYEEGQAVVCNRWHNLQWFCEDLKQLPGYSQWCVNKDYQLDKDILSDDTKIYSPSTCHFIPRLENLSNSQDKFIYKIRDGRGDIYITTRLIDFCREHSLDPRRLGEVMSDKADNHKGFTKVSKIEVK